MSTTSAQSFSLLNIVMQMKVITDWCECDMFAVCMIKTSHSSPSMSFIRLKCLYQPIITCALCLLFCQTCNKHKDKVTKHKDKVCKHKDNVTHNSRHVKQSKVKAQSCSEAKTKRTE